MFVDTPGHLQQKGRLVLPDLGAIAARLWNRKSLLLACGCLGAIVAGSVASVLPQRHAATAQILIDPRDLRVLEKEVTPRAVASDSGITVVESQVQVLTSNAVLERVIKTLELDKDPEFNGNKTSAIGQMMAAATALLSSKAAPEPSAFAALQALRQRVFTRRLERTFVIDLTVTSEDPAKSVRIADAIMQAYVEDQAQFRSSSNEGASNAIGAGLDGMRRKVTIIEQKIADYKAANDLMLTNGKLVSDQQLSEVTNQLSQARAEVNRLKARMDDMKGSRGALENIPEVLASASLITMKRQLATATAERSRLSAALLPNHPTMQGLVTQEREIRRGVDAEIARILQSAAHDYERAKANEISLAANVVSLQKQLSRATESQIALREMERELDATRSLYEQSVTRSKETREQARLDTSNVRVISSAVPALTRSFPPRGAILYPAGFAAGVVLGALFLVVKLLRVTGVTQPSSGTAEPRVARSRAPASKPPVKEEPVPRPIRTVAAVASVNQPEWRLRNPVIAPANVSPPAFAQPSLSATRGRIVTVAKTGSLTTGGAIVEPQAELPPQPAAPSRHRVVPFTQGLRPYNSTVDTWSGLIEGGEPILIIGPAQARSSALQGQQQAKDTALVLFDQFVNSGRKPSRPTVLQLVSSSPSAMKTQVTVSLATLAAERGLRTLVIDGDLVKGGATRLLQAQVPPSGRGRPLSLAINDHIVPTANAQIDVLTVIGFVWALRQSTRNEHVRNALQAYDLVIADVRDKTVPVLHSQDTAGSSRTILIDSGHDQDKGRVRQRIETLKSKFEGLSALLLTGEESVDARKIG